MTPSLRYAVLHHTGVESPHFDLLFETAAGSLLTTYRSDRWPPTTVLGDRLADHRRIYLEYEGPISGNRGQVRRVAGGWCSLRVSGERATLLLDTGEQIELIWRHPRKNGDSGA